MADKSRSVPDTLEGVDGAVTRQWAFRRWTPAPQSAGRHRKRDQVSTAAQGAGGHQPRLISTLAQRPGSNITAQRLRPDRHNYDAN